jgi:hypothetical protein
VKVISRPSVPGIGKLKGKENSGMITLSKEAALQLKTSIVNGKKGSYRIFMSGIG